MPKIDYSLATVFHTLSQQVLCRRFQVQNILLEPPETKLSIPYRDGYQTSCAICTGQASYQHNPP